MNRPLSDPAPDPEPIRRGLHATATARARYGVDFDDVDARGRVIVADGDAAERLAHRMNQVRGANERPTLAVSGAEVVAAGLLDLATHLLFDHYRRHRDPVWTSRLDADAARALGPDRWYDVRRGFLRAFPPRSVADGTTDADGWLAGSVGSLPAAQAVLEERLAVRIAAANPALRALHELVDETDLGPDDAEALTVLEQKMRSLPGLPGLPEGENDLWTLLRAPVLAHPDSLEGQLGYLRERMAGLLGDRFAAFDALFAGGLDLLREGRAGAPPGPPGPAPVLDPAHWSDRDQPEAFSPDADWMARVVLVAKNAYVWLDQLERRYGREVRTLRDVPDEALAELRERGFDALWLIGLWERSEASARIKRLRGQDDAVASAYALDEYRIAEDLGGDGALEQLREAAAGHGLRLAADMVPNHVGIDGRWVAEHPDRFVQLPHPPYPGYRFSGPDLSGDPRIEVRIEDGYWASRDAAVVFERTEAASGEKRYLYHGNDGTSMPWNDTAQIDFLNPEAREAVIQVILDVARRFPIIRFDAAMTLAKKHVRRLWYPPPGEGGAIPSRATHGAISAAAFEAAMPNEFWREVVDRVAAEAPGTLLLAEAFWMMEGTFVRNFGMHRVYNSAFMNMLAREANDEYQASMRAVLAFDPKILARFVNFMNNPDEETARAQFGDGDKAFAVTTLMATLPGLPMFGHGQVEGLREKYGMEYRRAKFDERPDPDLIARHRHEIVPLLRRRADFAGTDRFRLFEAEGEHGALPDVYAFANAGEGGTVHLVLAHVAYAEVEGVARRTVPFVPPHGGEPVVESFRDALGLEGGPNRFLRWRELPDGLERLAPAGAWLAEGLRFRLGPYRTRVLLDVRSFTDASGRWNELHAELNGRPVPDLDEAMRLHLLAPLHRAFAALAAEAGEGSEGGKRADADASAERADADADADADAGAERAGDVAGDVRVDARIRGAERTSERGEADAGTSERHARSVRDAGDGPDAGAGPEAGDATAKATTGRPGPGPGRPSLATALDAFLAAWEERPVEDGGGTSGNGARFDTERFAAYASRIAAPTSAHGGEPTSASTNAPSDASSSPPTSPPTRAPARAPGAAWRGAWAIAAAFDRPRAVCDAVLLDRAVARRIAESSDELGPEGWAIVWRALLPDRHPPREASDDASPRDEDPDGAVARALRGLPSEGPLADVLGVHEHDGVAWFRQEGFRAWRDGWLAVRALEGTDERRIEAWRRAFLLAERRSGYRFAALRTASARTP